MLLKCLEIQGFKSFPDKLHIDFSKGMTAIVGPNGSGKSNIAEAVRWVLGEQSSRNLRGNKMEDVIFGGTALRKPVGFAEVSLTLDNSDAHLPTEFNEVTLTRRYYRSGESEYYINRAMVRLKDIHELLMDTGLGRDGYSIIGQGRIAEILSQKSEERRQVFEEAAGISKFRYRKAEAVRKLTATEENLVRARDILSELEERVGPLAQEAQKARQFLDLREERKGLEINVWLQSIENSQKNSEKIKEDYKIIQAQMETLTVELEKLEADSEELFLENQRKNANVDAGHNRIRQLEEKLLTLVNSRALLENDKNHNQTSIKTLEEGSSFTQERMASLEQEVAQKLAQIEEKKAGLEAVSRALEKTAADREELLRSLSQASGETETLKSGIAALASKLTELRVELSSLTTEEQSTARRLESVDQDISAKKDAVEQAISSKNELRQGLAALGDDLKSLRNMLDGYQKKLAAREQKHEEYTKSLSDILSDIDKKTHQMNLLEDMERFYEGFSASVKTVMQRAGGGRLRGIHGPVSSLITVQPDYAAAVEIALGSATQQIVVDAENDAKAAIALLKNENAGRATFLPISSIRGSTLSQKDLSSARGFVGIASALVKADSKYQGVLESLLGRTAVVEGIDDAVELARKNQYRFKIVTLDGQVINAGGSMTGGSVGRNSGVLSRKNDIVRLKGEIAALEERRLETEKNHRSSQTEVNALRASLEGIQAESRVQEDAVIRKNAELEQSDLLVEGLEYALERRREERQHILESRGDFELRATRAREQIARSQSEMEQLEARLESLGVGTREIEEGKEALNEIISGNKLQELTLIKDIEGIQAAIESIGEQKDSFSIEVESRSKQLDELRRKNAQIEESVALTQQEEDNTRGLVEAARADLSSLSQGRERLEQEITRARALIKDKTREKERLLQENARIENKLGSFESEHDNLARLLWDEYELTVSAARELKTELESFTKAQSRINELKRQIKQLGDVNVNSIEEYKTVGERYEFLSEQVGDLESSKTELAKIIDELTMQMQEIFKKQFVEINRHFGQVFAQLFGGGNAELSLVDPSDVLSSGIDIQVEPPGKIIKNLSALSGGEQAFVAIALYFAILKVRPTPFCVLDEIEAALDDPNVLRFANYLKNLTASTQFIVITHRRGTMESADMLYGVTMEEQGVSKILAINVLDIERHIGLGSE